MEAITGIDVDLDLVRLKINGNNFNEAHICKLSQKTGSKIYAIGASRGFVNTFSQGIITTSQRIVDGVSYVQHDASITHGNSGGPLINEYGEVIGINTWGVDDSQNLNFAISAENISKLSNITPISLSDYYNKYFKTPWEKLKDLIITSGVYKNNRYEIQTMTDTSLYTLSFDSNKNKIIASTYYETSDKSIYIGFTILETTSVFDYGFIMTTLDNSPIASVYGYFDANTFSSNTTIKYVTYNGPNYNYSYIMEYVNVEILATVDWLDWVLENSDDGITIEDLGFLSFDIE